MNNAMKQLNRMLLIAVIMYYAIFGMLLAPAVAIAITYLTSK
jgi:hypothetical protein